MTYGNTVTLDTAFDESARHVIDVDVELPQRRQDLSRSVEV